MVLVYISSSVGWFQGFRMVASRILSWKTRSPISFGNLGIFGALQCLLANSEVFNKFCLISTTGSTRKDYYLPWNLEHRCKWGVLNTLIGFYFVHNHTIYRSKFCAECYRPLRVLYKVFALHSWRTLGRVRGVATPPISNGVSEVTPRISLYSHPVLQSLQFYLLYVLYFARYTENGQRKIPIENLMNLLRIIIAMVKYVILPAWQGLCKLDWG